MTNTKKYKITNVQWDTDGFEVDIPSVIIYDSGMIVADDVEDMISNWLSDTYGWCHFGFVYEEIN